MAVVNCAACTRPAGAGFLLCGGCADRLADSLQLVPDLLVDLEITECRQDVITVSNGSPSAETGLPFKQLAVDARAALSSTVGYWALRVDRQRGGVPQGTGAAAVWLSRRLDWLRMHEQAGQAYAELRGVVVRATAAVDRPAMRARFEVGPCPCTNHPVACPGVVCAYIPTREVDPAMLRCRHPECGASWSTPEWLRAGKLILRRMGRTV